MVWYSLLWFGVTDKQRTLSGSMSWEGFLRGAVWQIKVIQAVTNVLYKMVWYGFKQETQVWQIKVIQAVTNRR